MKAIAKLTVMIKLLLLPAALAACAAASAAAATGVPEEARRPEFLLEVMRHLYRWHLDEHDIEAVIDRPHLRMRLRDATPRALDPGDNSRMLKMGLPDFGLRLLLKKTDYRIEELDLEVRGHGYKIIDVARHTGGAVSTGAVEEIKLDMPELRDYVLETRAQNDRLPDALIARVQAAVLQRILEDTQTRELPLHEIHVAPLSPVANELWIFWETGRRLIRVTSDIEITDPAVWRHEHLSVRIFNIDLCTVVSLAEVPGSNAYLTRDQVGRVLYNCMILGARHEVRVQP